MEVIRCKKGKKNNGAMRAKTPHYSVIFHFIDKLNCPFGQDNLPQNIWGVFVEKNNKGQCTTTKKRMVGRVGLEPTTIRL